MFIVADARTLTPSSAPPCSQRTQNPSHSDKTARRLGPSNTGSDSHRSLDPHAESCKTHAATVAPQFPRAPAIRQYLLAPVSKRAQIPQRPHTGRRNLHTRKEILPAHRSRAPDANSRSLNTAEFSNRAQPPTRRAAHRNRASDCAFDDVSLLAAQLSANPAAHPAPPQPHKTLCLAKQRS